MCNPRRVRVIAARRIAEAWQEEVHRQVRRTGVAVGEARVREQLSSTLGAPTLAALAGALAAAPGWERRGEAFQHELDGGYVRYDPGTRELEIVATATGEVEVSAEAAATVGGVVEAELEEEGEGVYYDDGWGATTEETARHTAEQTAARNLDAAARRRVAEARQQAVGERAADVLAQASEQAEAALAEASAARAVQLRAQAAARLTAVGIEGRNLFHLVLATAYRDAILAYARSRGAEGIRCTEGEGVVDIEFELEVG